MSLILALLTLGASPPFPFRGNSAEIAQLAKNTARSRHATRDDDDDDDEPRARKSKAEPRQTDSDDQPVAAPPSPPEASAAQAPAAHDQAKVDDDDDEDEEGRVQPDNEIVVSARSLDEARTRIDAALGVSAFVLSNETVENRPGGETGSLSALLGQAPGATLSAQGLTVRGASADQVRINNVIVPGAIADPADHLSGRLAETTRLMTGALPAQFGFAPGGVISVTTKNGLYQHGGQAEFFAGSRGMLEPALEWAGSLGSTSLFGSGSFERDRTSVSDATGPLARDSRHEVEGLAFADHVLDANRRVSLIVGGSRERHRIGATDLPAGTEGSDDLYGVATYQQSGTGYTVQASLFGGVAGEDAHFTTRDHERRRSSGTQIDLTADAGTAHVLRAGLLLDDQSQRERDGATLDPERRRTTLALYAQDEWKLLPTLSFNPGVRVEWLRGVSSKPTPEPRASVVWDAGQGLTVHAGYARYAAVARLGEEPVAAPFPTEHDDYFDAGLQKRLGGVTLEVDGYWRTVRNLLAEHTRVGSATAADFAYARARIRGVEFSANYADRGGSAWASLAISKAEGRTIIGGASLFGPATLAAAAAGYLPLSSDRPVSASAGVTRKLGRLTLSGEVQASSGAVRTDVATAPNAARQPAFALLSAAAVYHASLAGRGLDLRIDLTNLTDVRPEIGDATALAGGWSRYQPGRAIMFGVEQGF